MLREGAQKERYADELEYRFIIFWIPCAGTASPAWGQSFDLQHM
jgi:hypothetical protein